ncbi:hypothetical protein L1987_18240 [Smallanthus sonchifolius]|uniref:Uncharacterized protein n=1 Tax=Smallanthus sonchifolius TaxID=185202 RepID=A0ACB9J1S6_9ASTR|nr:hypothetical protein L1987_18240 [Smallanthus sonchifolius]
MDNETRPFDGQKIMALASEEIKEPILSNNGHDASLSAAFGSSLDAANTPVVLDEITSNLEDDPSQNNVALVQPNQTRSISRIASFQGLIERVRRTVRGSSDDIGWLQRSPQMPPVEDGTERFTNILEIIRHDVHMLPNSMVYLLVPACFLLGHSKGGIDSAAALSMYWPDLRDKVAGLALAQSPYGGSPIASDILREGQIGDYFNVRKLMEILIGKVIKLEL